MTSGDDTFSTLQNTGKQHKPHVQVGIKENLNPIKANSEHHLTWPSNWLNNLPRLPCDQASSSSYTGRSSRFLYNQSVQHLCYPLFSLSSPISSLKLNSSSFLHHLAQNLSSGNLYLGNAAEFWCRTAHQKPLLSIHVQLNGQNRWRKVSLFSLTCSKPHHLERNWNV